ncbi:MAG: aminopeptidase [Clostridia bacterium]|jgi:aminopeptidase|nr:aminopeptidase [Clostridia bacterium]
MDKKRLQKYAELIVKCGLNVQKGQEVIIRCDLDQPEFVATCVEECYKCGAERVKVEWSYMPVTKLNLNYRSLQSLSEFTAVEKAEWERKVEKLSCLLWLDSDDPDGLDGTDSEKISKSNQARFPFIKPYRDSIENKYQWCIAAVPGKEWAKKIYPALPADQAVEKLWEDILLCSRVDDDPIKAWEVHNANLAKRCKFLNDYRFEKLEYTSANGTNFTVGLNPKGIFLGGGEYALGSNIYYNPNIPSEEVFTTPARGVAEGKVVATKPLSYQGKLIENFWVRFEKGKVVEVYAERNQDLLEKMVSMDEGAAYLGEVALIAHDSPINNTGILFYNTLYDENASCHLALGRGFNNCLEGYESLTNAQCEEQGVNSSMIHVDFMIGSKDMSIVGITKNGERVQVFKNGNWAF